jgi:hypothetical protein
VAGNGKVRIFIVLAVALTAAIALIAPIEAGNLRNSGGAGATGNASVIGSQPGAVMWTYYDTTQPAVGNGDNLLRLINPNGNANPSFGAVNNVCAMIYVFDDEQEMGECCGCPLSPADLATFSVEHDLTNNWIFGASPDGNEVGAIAVVAAAPNVAFVPNGSSSNGQNCPAAQNAACNSGCDPTFQPGFSVSTANNLLGSTIHNQTVGLWFSAFGTDRSSAVRRCGR